MWVGYDNEQNTEKRNAMENPIPITNCPLNWDGKLEFEHFIDGTVVLDCMAHMRHNEKTGGSKVFWYAEGLSGRFDVWENWWTWRVHRLVENDAWREYKNDTRL